MRSVRRRLRLLRVPYYCFRAGMSALIGRRGWFCCCERARGAKDKHARDVVEMPGRCDYRELCFSENVRSEA